MKKIWAIILLVMFSTSAIAQDPLKEKKNNENMGQSVSEVNANYRDQMKALRRDESISRNDRKMRKKELKEMKNNRIAEIKEGAGKKHDNDMDGDRSKNKVKNLDNEKTEKEKKEKKEMKENKEKGMKKEKKQVKEKKNKS